MAVRGDVAYVAAGGGGLRTLDVTDPAAPETLGVYHPSGAAAAVGLVIPELQGKMTGMALRVPTPTGSIVDLTVETAKPVTADAVNAAMKEAADGPMKGILKYTEDPIVLTDVIGDPHSSIFVGPWTQVIGDTMLKVLSWYDNEWGYSCRSVDLIEKMAKL